MKKIFLFLYLTFFIVCLFGQSASEKSRMSSNIEAPPISVTIGGEFIVTGSFPAYSGERLDQFITRVYNEALARVRVPTTDEKIFLEIMSKSQDYPLRDIKLKRKDGSELTLDLLKFRLSGDFENNPYLMNDDVIIFPGSDKEYDFIEISGAVNKPVKFQYVTGDKLSDAIFFAHGLNNAYENINYAVISRLSYDGDEENLIKVNIYEEFELKSGDRIRVQADQTRRKNYKVQVLGEVINPGEYYITENSTTINEVIEKAGGYTQKASLKDAELIRNFTKQQILVNQAIQKMAEKNPSLLISQENELRISQILETLKMYRASNLYVVDTAFFNIDNQLRILEGENKIDFRDLDSTNSIAANYTLRDGDIIIIPEKLEAVYVFGQVASTGYYKYEAGMDYKFYIEKAGGFTSMVKDDDEIFIIKGKNREWVSINNENYKIEPGDYIYVLKKFPRSIWYTVGIIGTIASILGSIATLVLLFK